MIDKFLLENLYSPAETGLSKKTRQKDEVYHALMTEGSKSNRKR